MLIFTFSENTYTEELYFQLQYKSNKKWLFVLYISEHVGKKKFLTFPIEITEPSEN